MLAVLTFVLAFRFGICDNLFSWESMIPPEGTEPPQYRKYKNGPDTQVQIHKKVTHLTCVTIKSVLLNPQGSGSYGATTALGVSVSNVTDYEGSNPYDQTVGPVQYFAPGSSAMSQTLINIPFPRKKLCFANTPSLLQFSLLIGRSVAGEYARNTKYMTGTTKDLSLGDRQFIFVTGSKVVFKVQMLNKKQMKKALKSSQNLFQSRPPGDSDSNKFGPFIGVIVGSVVVVLVVFLGWSYRLRRRSYEEIKAPPPIQRISLDLNDSHATTDVRRPRVWRNVGRRTTDFHERTPLSPTEPLGFSANYMSTYRSPREEQ